MSIKELNYLKTILMKSKLFFLSLLMTLVFSINYAQTTASDAGIAIQGIARDNNNTAVANSYLSFDFSLYHSSPPQIIFQEIKRIKTDAFGVFSYVLNVAPSVYTSFAANQVFLKIQDYTTGVIISDEVLKQVPYAIAASNGVPTGSIMPFIGTVAPSGWVLCNGQSLTTVKGAAGLIALLGSNSVPDLQGAFLKGAGRSIKAYVVEAPLKDFQDQSLKNHNHNSGALKSDNKDLGNLAASADTWKNLDMEVQRGRDYTNVSLLMTKSGDQYNSKGNHDHAISGSTADAGDSTEIRPYNYGVNYIIKL
jgi:microcystin-dependent protein